MREGELTYDDFLRRLNIQDVLIDAGYHLNRSEEHTSELQSHA